MGKKQQMLQERHPRSAAPRSRPKPELIIQDQYQHKDLDFQDQDFDQDSKKLSLETCWKRLESQELHHCENMRSKPITSQWKHEIQANYITVNTWDPSQLHHSENMRSKPITSQWIHEIQANWTVQLWLTTQNSLRWSFTLAKLLYLPCRWFKELWAFIFRTYCEYCTCIMQHHKNM